jgi:hypothetical protein
MKKEICLMIAVSFIAGCSSRALMVDAAKAGDVATIQQMAARVNINEQDYMYRTPLITAIIHEKKEVALYLIRKGAKTDTIDYSGMDAMTWATIKEYPDIKEALKTAEAKPCPAEKRAGIFFIRTAKYPLYGAPVFIDGSEVFVLSSKGAFYYAEVDTGKHEIASLSRGSGWKRMMGLDAGKIYFIILEPLAASIASSMTLGAVGYFIEGQANKDSSGPWKMTIITETAGKRLITDIVMTE